MDEARLLILRKNHEIKQLKDEMAVLLSTAEQTKADMGKMEKDVAQLEKDNNNLRKQIAEYDKEIKARDQQRELQRKSEEVNKDVPEARRVEILEATVEKMKLQVTSVAIEANNRHNEQQNQLQGYEAVRGFLSVLTGTS